MFSFYFSSSGKLVVKHRKINNNINGAALEHQKTYEHEDIHHKIEIEENKSHFTVLPTLKVYRMDIE